MKPEKRRDYERRRRETHRRLNVWFSNDMAEHIEIKARLYGLTVDAFLRQTIMRSLKDFKS